MTTSRKKILFTVIGLIILGFLLFGLYTIFAVVQNAKKANTYVKAAFYPKYPPINTLGKDPTQIAELQRGEYLVKVGDCIACHTDTTQANAPAFAGGLPMQTPFGVIHTPNITPDKASGIGNWTEKDFKRAMRHGIAPNGEYYFPAFPYPYFNRVTDEDLKSMFHYLQNIPAVYRENKAPALLFPLNWRIFQLGWRLMFFDDIGPYQNHPKQSDQWNRGAYLVEGLGHCGMCHTPSYYMVNEMVSLGAPIKKYNLTGAVVQGYLAPNITKSNLGAINNDELMRIFNDATLIGGSAIEGPMLEAIHDSLTHLTQSDLLAMIVYLKTVESEMPRQPKIMESGLGETIYNNYCSACHTLGLAQSPKLGDAAMWDPLIKSGIDKLYAVAIHGVGNMPPKGSCYSCSDLDIKLAVDYMITAAMKPEKHKVVAPAGPMMGQKVYAANCSTCHNEGKDNAPKLGDKAIWAPIEQKGFLNIYRDIVTGQKGHPVHGGCPHCTDEELIAALKYMLQQGATKNNYLLW